MLSEGEKNTPLEQAMNLATDDIEEMQLQEARTAEDNRPVEDKIQPGSWERLQGALGRVK